MLKTLDRYILRALFTNYVIAMAVMIGLYIVLDLFVNLDEFTNVTGDSPAQTMVKIIDYYGHNLLVYFAQLAGAILLMAACFTLGRLHRTNELTAILASGTSLYRVAAPVLIAALGLNALWVIDQELLIPRFADKLARGHGDIEGRHSFAVWFQPDRDNALVSANQFHPQAHEMRGVIIMKRDADNRMTEVIRADRADWDPERRVWHLDNGSRMRFAASEADPTAPVTEADLGAEPIREYASDLQPRELALQQASLWTSFMSLREIERLRLRFAESGTSEFIKLKHRRLTVVFVNIIMICIGMSFFLNRERASVVVVGGRCMAACALCFVITFFFQQTNLDLIGVPPALAIWLPVLIFGPVAVVLMDGIKT